MPTPITWNEAVGTALSPNGRYAARFSNPAEFREHTYWYELEIGPVFIGERFADRCLWSPDSRYFAACQYVMAAEDPVIRSQLVIVDLAQKAACTLRASDSAGLALPVRFEQTRILCQQTSFARSANIGYMFGVDLTQVEAWEEL